MAKRSAQDIAAAKAKKQKIILIVGGVLLLAVAALQGPKLMKRRRVGRRSGAGCRRRAPTGAPDAGRSQRPRPVKGSAVVAGVALPRATAVKVETNQLASFTLFEAKDPFVQKVGDGRRPPTPRQPPADQGAGSTGTTTSSPPAPPARRPPGPAPAPAAPPPDHLRHDRLQREAAAGGGQGHVPEARAAVRRSAR